MADFQKKINNPKNTNIWHHPVFLIVMLFLVLVFIYNMIDIIEKKRETSKKRDLITNQINELNQRQEVLKNDIEHLKTNEGIEETIREKYQLVKEGEKMVVIVDENQEENINIDIKKESKITHFFKNIFN